MQFNVLEGSVSLIGRIPTHLFWPHNSRQGVGLKLPASYYFMDRELLFIEMKLETQTQ